MSNNAQAHHKMSAVFSEMLTESDDFNRCVENDFFLAQILSEKVKTILDGVSCSELFFYQNENLSIKVYHEESGEQINYFIQSLIGNSLLGKAIQQQQLIYIADTKDANFNREIDCPINYKADKSIKNLNIVHILLPDIGVLRIYLQS